MRTLLSICISITAGVVLLSLGPAYAAIGSFIVFISLETAPRIAFWRVEELKHVAEKKLVKYFQFELVFERKLRKGGDLKRVSDVQAVFLAEVVSQDCDYQEVWLVCGDWFLGSLKKKISVYGKKDGEMDLLFSEVL